MMTSDILPSATFPAFAARFVSLFVDRRRSVSRPKVLFTVALLDALSIFFSSALASFAVAGNADYSLLGMVRASLVAVLVISALHVKWSYSISALRSASGQLSKVFITLLTVFLTLTGAAYMVDRVAPSPAFVVAWMSSAFVLLGLVRIAAARVVSALTAAGLLVRKTVLVGGGKEADDLIAAFQRDGAAQLQILGVFDDRTG
ncbi:MAG TPA: undecaprenyl-phosphate glucose phosphotransferase, partial [Hyphomicrobium sp.]|nr:undecaprenyl-phosphate glucose phosphotransferase [Hyphomicrobium sp.]